MVLSMFASTPIVPLSRTVIMPLMAQSPSTSRAKHAQACVQTHTHPHTVAFLSTCHMIPTFPPPSSYLSTGLDSFSSSLLLPLFFFPSIFSSTPFFLCQGHLNECFSPHTSYFAQATWKVMYHRSKKSWDMGLGARECVAIKVSVNINSIRDYSCFIFSFQCMLQELK